LLKSSHWISSVHEKHTPARKRGRQSELPVREKRRAATTRWLALAAAERRRTPPQASDCRQHAALPVLPFRPLLVFGGLFLGFCQAIIATSKRGPWASFNRYFRLVCVFTPS
jgi:hypothetical protein